MNGFRCEMSFTSRVLSCISAALFFFYTIFQKVTFNVISADLISHFHLGVTGLGAMSSAYLYANALWLIPGGILLERFSARKVTILFMLICACTSFVFACSPSVFLDVVMRFVAGLGSAMSLLISLRLATCLFPKHSARVIGLLVSIGMSAGFFANSPFLYLVNTVGWQESLLFVGYFGLIISAFMFIFLHDKPDDKLIINFSFSNLYRDFKTVIKHIENWKCGVYIGLMNLPVFILASLWGNLYLVNTGSFSAAKASFIVSMIFIGEITGAPIVGWISDHMQSRKLVMMSGAVLSLIISVLVFDVTAFSFFAILCLFFLLGFTISAQVVGYSVIAENNNIHVMSMASGFGSFIVNILGAICQILFPILLMLQQDTKSIVAYKTAYLMFPVAFLLSIVIAIRIRETLGDSIISLDRFKKSHLPIPDEIDLKTSA